MMEIRTDANGRKYEYHEESVKHKTELDRLRAEVASLKGKYEIALNRIANFEDMRDEYKQQLASTKEELAALKEQNALLTVQKEEVMRAWADALIEEIDAIPCRYHGDPSYDHDAYWMKGAVKDLIGKMMKWPPIPVKDRYIPDSECSQGKCANPTTGCFGKCYIAKHPEWPNVSLPPALPQQVKSEDARDAERAGWHAYQIHKKQADEIKALKEEIARLSSPHPSLTERRTDEQNRV